MRCLTILGWGLMTLVMAGAAASESRPAPRKYVDQVQGFSLGVPGAAQSVKERTVVASFSVGVDDGFVSNVNIIVDPVKTTLAEYMEKSLEELKLRNPGAKYNSIQTIQVSGKPAQLLDIEASGAGRRLRFLQLVVADDDRVFILTCTAPAENGFLARQKEFQACVESFRLEGR